MAREILYSELAVFNSDTNANITYTNASVLVVTMTLLGNNNVEKTFIFVNRKKKSGYVL